MKIKLYSILLGLSVIFSSCQGLVEGLNDNPNKIVPEDINPELFVTGPMLANTVIQAGHLNRISGMYSGQLIGFSSLYSNIYGYSISTAESNSTWNAIYIGVITNSRYLREVAPNDKLLVGISKVLEAHAIGTGASLFGDIPYSQINNEAIADPIFDSQSSVYNSIISLLDEAIVDLKATAGRGLSVDVYFGGNVNKWIEVAYTLKARYYLQLKDYPNALIAAQNGISSAAGNMKHIPRGDPNVASGDKNLFWMILAGSRAGDIGTGNSYLMQLIDPGNAQSRNNAKTDETARHGYYYINEVSASSNNGIVAQFEPQNLVTYQENQLIMAECEVRAGNFALALGHLNDLRAFYNTGGMLNANYSGNPLLYDAYVAADFDAAGIENVDGSLTPERALLREIIEERYVSGFGTYMPFNDARRLRKSDSDVAVAIPFNNGTATQHPERLPYSDDELNSNSNAPAQDPGIFTVTEVNK
ncbi:MAG: SusD/RagB family nutrient-binding outer membrane lipoprotein [Cyclobacteriaceae bacterium]|nr:SusD/RagB family nutrient-binding outer membrane lipoprotein [Cyclobacteriaceae bacterium]